MLLIFEIMTIASDIANVIKALSEIIEPVSIIIAGFLQIKNLVKKKKKKTAKRKKNRKKKKTTKKSYR